MKKQVLKVAFFATVLLLSACGHKRATLSEADYNGETPVAEVASNDEAAPAPEATGPTAEETKEALEALVAAGEPAEEVTEDAGGDAVAALSQETQEATTEVAVAGAAPSMDETEAALSAPQLIAQADMPVVSSQATTAPVEKPKARRHVKRETSSDTSSNSSFTPVEPAVKAEEPTAKTEEPKTDSVVASNTTVTAEVAKTDEVDQFAPAPVANPVQAVEVQTASVGIEGMLQKHPFAIALILVGAIGFVFIIARMRRNIEV